MNPNSIESRFVRIFLQSLVKINAKSQDLSQSSSTREIFRRYLWVRVAADESMARAVGSGWVWSRSYLWRSMMIRRNKARRKGLGKRIRIQNLTRRNHRKTSDKSSEKEKDGQIDSDSQATELRRLVPGGESMDLQRLLSETAHYIKCLGTQVKVMTNILDLYSN